MIPLLAAADADAPRVECALKIAEFTPAWSSIDFNHHATVLDVTALWGFTCDINNFVSSPLKDSVLLWYILSVVTGHNVEFDGNDVTALWGFTCDINNFVSSPLKDSVLLWYYFECRHRTQCRVRWECDGKNNSAIGFPGRDCFATVVGKRLLRISRISISEHPALLSG